MTLRGAASIVGAYEHPLREIPDRTLAEIHAEVALGALADAGLTPGRRRRLLLRRRRARLRRLSMAEYLGLRCALRRLDRDRRLVVPLPRRPRRRGHRRRQVHVALITLAGKPRTGGRAGRRRVAPERSRRRVRARGVGMTVPGHYALAARRHMHEFGTTSAQLAEIKVAASHARPAQPARLPAATRSPSRRCSSRRWSPTRCTASTAASSPTAAARSSSSAPRSPATCGGGA